MLWNSLRRAITRSVWMSQGCNTQLIRVIKNRWAGLSTGLPESPTWPIKEVSGLSMPKQARLSIFTRCSMKFVATKNRFQKQQECLIRSSLSVQETVVAMLWNALNSTFRMRRRTLREVWMMQAWQPSQIRSRSPSSEAMRSMNARPAKEWTECSFSRSWNILPHGKAENSLLIGSYRERSKVDSRMCIRQEVQTSW